MSSLEYSLETNDFFETLKQCTSKAVDVAHDCFKLVVTKAKGIKEGDYDRREGEKAIAVTKVEISDDRGFKIEGFGFAGTPSLNRLGQTIEATRDVLSLIGLYTSPPFPDEKLRGRIEIEHMPLDTSGVFRVTVIVDRRNNGRYAGNIITSFDKIVHKEQEARLLLDV